MPKPLAVLSVQPTTSVLSPQDGWGGEGRRKGMGSSTGMQTQTHILAFLGLQPCAILCIWSMICTWITAVSCYKLCHNISVRQVGWGRGGWEGNVLQIHSVLLPVKIQYIWAVQHLLAGRDSSCHGSQQYLIYGIQYLCMMLAASTYCNWPMPSFCLLNLDLLVVVVTVLEDNVRPQVLTETMLKSLLREGLYILWPLL